ncbi:hypothetical protein [Streptomyces pratensis]|uniref:hypothetical protein n=1 Tax=Streptomyces pratensis TaxID=1169025 RepID=UPI00362742E1
MRIRLLLTGIALGAITLVGGATTAQAAPTPSETTAKLTAAAGEEYIGTFSRSACIELRDSYAGYARCDAIGGGWYELWVRV